MVRKFAINKWLWPLFVLVLSLVGYFLITQLRSEPEPVAVSERAWPVDLMVLSPQKHSPIITLFGLLESPRTANLTASVEADVRVVHQLEGEMVAKESIILELDSAEIDLSIIQRQADLDEAKAALKREQKRHENNIVALEHEKHLLRLSSREVERVKSLARKSLSAKSQLDDAMELNTRQKLALDERKLSIAEFENLKQQLNADIIRLESLLERTKLDLRRSKVVSPFEGRIIDVKVSEGDRVRVGDPLVSVYDINKLEVRAQVPLRYVANIRRSLQQNKTLSGYIIYEGNKFDVKIVRLSAEVKSGSGGADVFLQVQNKNSGQLELGATVPATIYLAPEDDVIPVPIQSIYGNNLVYLERDSRMQAVEIERVGRWIGEFGEEYILIRSPELSADSRIISTHLPNAFNGLKVSVGK